MGNTCSNTPTRTLTLNKDDQSGLLSQSIWNYNPVENPTDVKFSLELTLLYNQIYLASFCNSDAGTFCGHLFFIYEKEGREYRRSFLFFKFVSKPTRITIEKQNEELKISFIGDETKTLFQQVWIQSEYKLSEDGHLISIVKKKMIDGVSSDIPIIDESAQDASATGGGNASSASEDVSSSNGSHVGLGQGVFTVSQTHVSLEVHSAAQRVPSDEIDNGTGASASQTDVQRLSVDSQDDESETPAPEVFEGDNSVVRLHQIAETYVIENRLFEETTRTASGGGNSAVKDVNRLQGFARCGPVEESTTGRKTVLTFSGKQHLFTVLPYSNQIVYKRLDWNSQQNIDNPVQFGIINISSLTVHELLEGVYLIVIHTSLGQTYLSGYLSTNATPIFATCQITSNLEERRFQSFAHVSGTVFKCIFSDGTKRIFSIESGSYATINEVLDA